MLLHQIWYNFGDWGKVQAVPKRYDRFRQSWLDVNPGLTVMLWDERSSEQLLRQFYPDLLHKFLSFPTPIQRADFFRWVAVYHFSGIYADMDCLATTPVASILHKKSEKIRDGYYPVLVVAGSRWAGNACFLATAPRHPAIKKIIETMAPNSGIASFFGSESVVGIFTSTGPAFVRKVLAGERSVIFSDGLLLHCPGEKEDGAPLTKGGYVAVHYGHGSWGYSALLWRDVARILAAAVLLVALLVALVFLLFLFFRNRKNPLLL